MDDKERLNFCEAFAEKVAERQGIENKARYLLEDFFFDEGWASRTNPKVQKEGYSAQLTYNESTIKHFIEDFVRLFQKEWDDSVKLVDDKLTRQQRGRITRNPGMVLTIDPEDIELSPKAQKEFDEMSKKVEEQTAPLYKELGIDPETEALHWTNGEVFVVNNKTKERREINLPQNVLNRRMHLEAVKLSKENDHRK